LRNTSALFDENTPLIFTDIKFVGAVTGYAEAASPRPKNCPR